jgi:hypothetical protein
VFQTKVVEKFKTHILFTVTFFSDNRDICKVKWKNSVERGRPQMTICRMRTTCWIPKATNTHSEYVNTYWFPTATMVARTDLNVTLYVYCLSCTYFSGRILVSS